jgi:hypothetical protein
LAPVCAGVVAEDRRMRAGCGGATQARWHRSSECRWAVEDEWRWRISEGATGAGGACRRGGRGAASAVTEEEQAW